MVEYDYPNNNNWTNYWQELYEYRKNLKNKRRRGFIIAPPEYINKLKQNKDEYYYLQRAY